MVKYTAMLDLTDNGAFDTGWRIKQGDFRDSVLVVKVANNGEPFYDAENMPSIVFHRADGKSVIGTMTAGGNDSYQYAFIGNELEIAGPVVMDVKFGGNSAGRLSTASCIFTCVEDTLSAGATPADIYPGLTLEEVTTEATRVSTEVATEVAQRVGGSPLILTGQHRLTTSEAGKIAGLDVKGKSWQGAAIATVQGKLDNSTIGQPINQNVVADATKCVTAVMFLNSGVTINVTNNNDIFMYYSATASGNISDRSGWHSKAYTTTADGYYRFLIRHNEEAIKPSDFVLSIAPAPDHEIPIVNASGVIQAHTENLLPDIEKTGTFNGVTYTIDSDGTVTLNGTASTSGTLDFFRGTSALPDKWIVGKKYTLGAVFENNATPGTAHFDTYPYINGTWDTSKSVTFNDTGETEWTIPEGTVGILTRIGTSGGKTYNNLKIRPYFVEQSNEIDLSAYDLRSVEDIADQLIVYPDKTGKLIKRVTSAIYDGSEADWKQTATDRTFYLEGPNNKMGDIVYPTNSNNAGVAMCSHFTNHARNGIALGQFALTSGFNTMFYHSSQTIDEWKTWLAANNVTIYAVLKTPIETPLTAEQVAEILALETYAPETIIETELDLQSVNYLGDVKGYIDSKFEYSYTVRKIGKWADGKDFYQAVIKTTTPSALNSSVAVCDLIKSTTHSVKRLEGMIDASPYQDAINMYLSGSYHIATFIQREGIMMNVSVDLYANKPCEIIVEYTLKDSAPAAASVLSLDETEE